MEPRRGGYCIVSKLPDEGKKVYRLRKQITQLEDEIAMLREQNATLQRWHKEDMDNLKDDFHHEREELEKKLEMLNTIIIILLMKPMY